MCTHVQYCRKRLIAIPQILEGLALKAWRDEILWSLYAISDNFSHLIQNSLGLKFQNQARTVHYEIQARKRLVVQAGKGRK